MTTNLSQPLHAPDLLFSSLRTAEALITVSLRMRALHWRAQAQDHPDWRGGFQASGLPSWAVTAFDRLFQIVASAARCPLDVRSVDCPQLGSDEGQFLQVLSHFQHCRSEQAEVILRGWLPAAAFRLAAYPAASLACALQQAALVIPLRGVAAPVTAHQLSANRGLGWMQ